MTKSYPSKVLTEICEQLLDVDVFLSDIDTF